VRTVLRLAIIVIITIVSGTTILASAQEAARAENSGLTGLVVDTVGLPVPFAQVAVLGNRAITAADDSGRFQLRNLPSGKLVIQVRRVGFEPVYFDLELPPAMIVAVRVKMVPAASTLNTVEIDDIREPLRRVGFYQRMAAGNGHFVSPEMIESMRPVRATDAFRSIPNLVIDRRGNKNRIMTSNLRCEYAIVIDKISVGEAGSRVRTTSPDDLLTASDLYAIEVYPRNRGLPLQFLGMSAGDGCGTIVIWTKAMIAR